MPQGQDAAAGNVPNLSRGATGNHQRQRAVLASLFQKGLPEALHLWLKTRLYELINPAGDDLISRQRKQLASSEAGVQAVAVVVRDQDGLGRVVEDGTKQQLKFSGSVFNKPFAVLLLCAGGTHAIHSRRLHPESPRRRPATENDRRLLKPRMAVRTLFYQLSLTAFGHLTSRGQFY
jgi:hypothetical protein